jgi:hypothetical protein
VTQTSCFVHGGCGPTPVVRKPALVCPGVQQPTDNVYVAFASAVK